jgi:rhodanese-related sulfurtransferase
MFEKFFKSIKEAIKPKFENINPSEFASAIKKPNVQIIDVRSKAEVNEGSIRGHKHIDVQQSSFISKAEKTIRKDEPVYVYCKSGMRSSMACGILANSGFTQIYNMTGGYIAWRNAGIK